MLKYIVAMLCGVSLTGSVYMAGWGNHGTQIDGVGAACEYCNTAGMAMDMGGATTMPTIDMTGKVEVKNTKCIVSGDDIGGSKLMVEYKGKVYHVCCDDCPKEFNKDPEKFVAALEANPAKFGVKN